MIECKEHPFPKDPKVEVDVLWTSLIEERRVERGLIINVLNTINRWCVKPYSLENESENARPRCPEDVVQHW